MIDVRKPIDEQGDFHTYSDENLVRLYNKIRFLLDEKNLSIICVPEMKTKTTKLVNEMLKRGLINKFPKFKKNEQRAD